MVNVWAGEAAMSRVATECAARGVSVLSLFASFARMSRSRKFGERPKATTGTSLKVFLKPSVDCRMGCSLGVCHEC